MSAAFFVPALLVGVSVLVAYLTVHFERGSGDLLRMRRTEQPLAHEVPYWTFFDDAGAGVTVNVDLTYSTFLELRGLDTDCLDNDTLNQTTFALHGLLQNLPPAARLQFHHWTDEDVNEAVTRYRQAAAGGAEIGAALVWEKADYLLAAGGLRRSRTLLGVSLALAPPAKGPLAAPVRRFPAFSAAQHADALRRLRTVRDQIVRAVVAAGLRATPVSAAAMRLLVYQFLNPQRARAVADPFRTGATTPRPWSAWQSAREQLLFTGIEERRDRISLGAEHVRVLTLRSLPDATEPAMLEGLLVGLPFHCRVVMAIETLDSLKSLDALKRKRDQAHMLATLREKRNQEAEAQEDDVAELIDKNLRSSVRMVRVALSVVLSVDSREHDAAAVLERQTAEVLRVANSLHSMQLMVDELSQLDEFLAALPGNAGATKRWRQCTSENASHLFLGWQAWAGDERPMLLVQNGRGNLVGLDPFDEGLDNPNAFMAGSSGSGKSSTTNFKILNARASGAAVLVIDRGGSYRRTVEIFGGDYFAIRADGVDCALNPFFPHDAILVQGRLEERRLQFIIAVVERMVCDAGRPQLRNVERAVLGAAIEATYARVAGRAPLLEDLAAVLRRLEAEDAEDVSIARGLARDLRVWTEGPHARLVNRPSSIALRSDCAAFDLKGLESQPHLESVVMLILSGLIWDLVMRDATERKLVVFDEVWRLLESPASAQLIAELYRTSRKYRCSILTISQSVEDFTSSPIAGALVNNSATVYLLKHRRGHETVAEQFHLNPRELYVFQGLDMRRGEYTEALVLHGEHHFLARVVLSPLEYWIATTHPADLALERAFSDKYPHLPRLELLRTLAERHPQGAKPEPARAARAA